MYIDDLRRARDLINDVLASEEKKECCKEEAKKREEKQEKINMEVLIAEERKTLRNLSEALDKDSTHEVVLVGRMRSFIGPVTAPMTLSGGLAFQDLSTKLIEIHIKNRETKTSIRGCESRILFLNSTQKEDS